MVKRKDKSQSAMEYILTYGWMILLIAIVLAALYQLGVLSSPRLPIACLAAPAFICSNPILGSSGGLTINLSYSEISGQPITLTGLACNLTDSAAPPSVETTQMYLEPGSLVQLEFQCPIAQKTLGAGTDINLWLYYDTDTGQQQVVNFARGIAVVTYTSILWNVTEWTPTSNAVDLLNFADVSGSPAAPSQVTTLTTTQWSSLLYKGITGWSYSTDYHNHDIYNGIQTTLFPLAPLSYDNANCSGGPGKGYGPPYNSHGYTATAVVNMNGGSYTFNIISDDGTGIFYKSTSGGSWSDLYGSSAWVGQAPTFYTATIAPSAGKYEIAVDYIDICDPAGLSAVEISPPPTQPT